MVVDDKLPIGMIANTVSILGCALGKRHPEINGEDLQNLDEQPFPGLIKIPVPVLAANGDQLRGLKESIAKDELEVISFTDAAQHAPTYEDYRQSLVNKTDQQLKFLGLCIFGKTKRVNHYTGNLPTLK
nr:DUF2000 domain-containing protein [Liquorilactobacillus sicerae]